jgi:hypothetical protein
VRVVGPVQLELLAMDTDPTAPGPPDAPAVGVDDGAADRAAAVAQTTIPETAAAAQVEGAVTTIADAPWSAAEAGGMDAIIGALDRVASEDEVGPAASGEVTDPVEAVRACRDAAVASARRMLRRRLKSALAEDENQVLDGVRQWSGSAAEAHELLLGHHPERVRRFQVVAHDALAAAGRSAATMAGRLPLVPTEAGSAVAANPSLLGTPSSRPGRSRSIGATATAVGRADVDAREALDRQAAAVGEEVARGLRRRLRDLVEPVGPRGASAGSPSASSMDVGSDGLGLEGRVGGERDELLDRVRGAYRSVRTEVIDALSDRLAGEVGRRALIEHLPGGLLDDTDVINLLVATS